MSISLMERFSVEAALHSRMEQSNRFEGRNQYIGASEVGSCLRKVVLSKLKPEPFDIASMGRMLAGKALENEVVQIVRFALGGGLRSTGRAQLELKHATIPFIAHPDGIIIGGIDGLSGAGVLEVKTASASTFKKYSDSGLPQIYLDQVQSQLGLSKLAWALVFLVSRENLSETHPVILYADPGHYRRMEERASRAAQVLAKYNIQTEIEGEPERGFCHTCPYSGNCAAFCALKDKAKRGEIPEITRLQLECQLEELGLIESELTPMQDRVSELRDQIKTALLCSGASKITLDSGTVQIVESSRTGFDSKCLQREAPEVYSRFLKTSTFSNLRVTTRKGDSKCLSMAS